MSESSIAVVMYWLAMLALTFVLIAWEFYYLRFSLRTLLIALTLMAIMLGIIGTFI